MKNKILLSISEHYPYSFEEVKEIYDKLLSFDETIKYLENNEL